MDHEYQLALELKNAGFPQKKHSVNYNGDLLTYPSLEELIEACGNDFILLSKSITGPGEHWIAVGGKWDSKTQHERRGETPKEAVARLWLTLLILTRIAL